MPQTAAAAAATGKYTSFELPLQPVIVVVDSPFQNRKTPVGTVATGCPCSGRTPLIVLQLASPFFHCACPRHMPHTMID
jgi:hypothetical protein